jgi:hypothetical protein
MTDILPGMFGLAQISGVTGKLIRLGQRIVDGKDSVYTHAFLVVDDNRVIEAEPGGATFAPLSKYEGREDVLFSDAPIQLAVTAAEVSWEKVGYNFAVSEASATYEAILRRRVTIFGKQCEGIPYNYLDYFAIALEHFRIAIPAVKRRIEREDRMICSQLVDWAYLQCGIHLFDDNRLPQDVTPGDLAGYASDYSL